MIKVIWADDQQDVVQTFSRLLSTINASIEHTQNGVEALSRIKSRHFDILILDLMMPPDQWGGLWLLEQLREAQINIPTVVVSGEGTQNETIQALRLGAIDYVTKDRIQEELVERIRSALDSAATGVRQHAITQFPTLLSIPYKRYLSAATPNSQLTRLIEFYEACLRTCCLFGLCELTVGAAQESTPAKLISALIRGPSMGTWNQLRHYLAKHLPAPSAARSMHNSLDEGAVNSIIQLRNDISHGAELSDRLAQEHLDKARVDFDRIVATLQQRLSYRLILPINMRFDGKSFNVSGHILSGDSVTFPSTTVITSKAVICGKPYLVTQDMAAAWVGLYPLVCVESTIEPGAWRILVFDGVKIDLPAEHLSGSEPIRYIDLWSGQRNVVPESRPTSGSLPKLLRF